MRVADKMSFSLLLDNLSKIQGEIFKRTREIASGKRLHEPSQDPAPASRVVRLREELSRINQFQRNLQQANVPLGAAGEALNSLRNFLDVVQVRTSAALNDTLSQDGRDAIANELENILASMQRVANTRVDGKYVFSGSETGTQPFQQVAGTFVYQGDGENLRVEIADGREIKTSVPGDQVFTNPSNDLLNSMAALIADLRAGDLASARTNLDTVQRASTAIDEARVELAHSQQLIDETEREHEGVLIALVREASQLEDADMAEAISALGNAETRLQAALQTGARQRVSLFDLIG